MSRRLHRLRISSAAALLALGATGAAQADPTLRVQVDQRGDFILFGNSSGYECGNDELAPDVGDTTCPNPNGNNQSDSSVDLFWRSEEPGAGEATADNGIDVTEARSTAMLTVPDGATVTYARIYWAALVDADDGADDGITLDRPGGFSAAVAADDAATVDRGGNLWYQATADVTASIAGNGSGAYRVSGIDSIDVRGINNNDPMVAWSIVVFYELASEPTRNLALFDGLDLVPNGGQTDVAIGGFLVPESGFDAKLGVIAYEGEESLTGDSLEFNGTALFDVDVNPVDNFFNSSRSFKGVAVSNAGDLPQLSGDANSMSGVDLDVVDVTDLVDKGDTSATISGTSSGDTYLLGAFITSISTFKPDFRTSNKTFVDVNGGAVRPGDVLKYTIFAENSGSDAAIKTVMTDPLPVGVSYVPGTLVISSGANAGALTDAAGDDQGEYTAASRTVTVRLGTGADDATGGRMAIDDTSTVEFSVTVDKGFYGSILNQALITAEGEKGAPSSDYPTDGNGDGDGSPPTETPVDACLDDDECTSQLPHCDTGAAPKICVACLDDDDCDSAAAPDCLSDQTCGCAAGAGQCSDDADGDGLSDDEEAMIGTDPDDADSDDDGAPDGSEPLPGFDSDGDGLINALDPDSDDDGLWDGTELGFDCGSAGTDAGAGHCTADADEGATTTDPLNADTDAGGVSDGSEDFNLNGQIDDGETNPNNPADDVDVIDSDGDGLSDGLEATIGTDPDDADSDDDGVSDGAEPNLRDDTDGDGSINALDPDSDDDGLFDGTELGFDCSGDGVDAASNTCIPDGDSGDTTTSPLDPDTDRGGVKDGDEDKNHDGVVDSGETDPNDPSDDDEASVGAGGASGSGGSTVDSGGASASGATNGSGGAGVNALDGSIEGGGCGCRTAPSGGGRTLVFASLIGLLSLGMRRRKTKGCPPVRS